MDQNIREITTKSQKRTQEIIFIILGQVKIDKTPKAQTLKENIHKLDHDKIKIFCVLKYKEKTRKQDILLQDIFAKHLCERLLPEFIKNT